MWTKHEGKKRNLVILRKKIRKLQIWCKIIKSWKKSEPQGGSTRTLTSFSYSVVFSFCTLLLYRPLTIWGGDLSSTSLGWLHQSKATADSLHTGIILIFFFFFNWGRVSVIIAISPSFPCSSLIFGTYGWSFSDGTTHLTCSWRGCCEARCVLVLMSFTPLRGDTAGFQESQLIVPKVL